MGAVLPYILVALTAQCKLDMSNFLGKPSAGSWNARSMMASLRSIFPSNLSSTLLGISCVGDGATDRNDSTGCRRYRARDNHVYRYMRDDPRDAVQAATLQPCRILKKHMLPHTLPIRVASRNRIMGARGLTQKTEVDRVEVVTNLLKLTLPLADTIDPMLAALVCQSLHRAFELSTSPRKPDRGAIMQSSDFDNCRTLDPLS